MFAKRNKSPSIETTKLSSLIAEDVEIIGDLSFTSGLRIDGRVIGNVSAHAATGEGRALLVVSDKGRIEGTVRCGDAIVNGCVVGGLDVEHFLELQSNARVSGTIRYRHLRMDVGAVVQGQLIQIEAMPDVENVVALELARTV